LALLVTEALAKFKVRATLFIFTLAAFHFASVNTNGLSEGPIICPFRLITGINCPSCGTTRALGELSRGNLEDSLNLNPMGMLVMLIGGCWVINPNFLKLSFVNAKNFMNSLKPVTAWAIWIAIYATAWVWNFWRQGINISL